MNLLEDTLRDLIEDVLSEQAHHRLRPIKDHLTQIQDLIAAIKGTPAKQLEAVEVLAVQLITQTVQLAVSVRLSR